MRALRLACFLSQPCACILRCTALRCPVYRSGPCTLLYKELRHMAALLPDDAPVSILLLDVDANADLASQLSIKALPTMVFFGPNGDGKAPIYTQGVMSGALVKETLMNKATHYAGTCLDKDTWVRL